VISALLAAMAFGMLLGAIGRDIHTIFWGQR
jgi:hypothetical protein